MIGDIQPPERNYKTGSDTVDLMSARLPARQNRRFRGLDRDDADLRIVAAQRFSGTAKGSRCTHALHKAIDLSAGLLPDFFRHFVVGHKLVRIIQLIGPEASWPLRED